MYAMTKKGFPPPLKIGKLVPVFKKHTKMACEYEAELYTF